MPSSWDLDNVTNEIWVAPSGTGDGSSESSPLDSIQSAINVASAGTVILVKAGTYYESLSLDSSNGVNSGTSTSPIFLVSADGIAQAVIQSSGGNSTIESWRVSNWAIVGFKLVCNGWNGDKSPIKIGGKLTTGTQSNNWFVAGNLLTGTGTDGTKFYGGRNIFWFGNTYTGTWKEEACDEVIVGVQNTSGDDNQFAFNTVAGEGGYTGMTLKYGSNNFQIFNNDFQIDTSIGLMLGGFGDLAVFLGDIPEESEAAFNPPTAQDLYVKYNSFSVVSGINLKFYGSKNCEVSYNLLDNQDVNNEIADQQAYFNGGAYTYDPVGHVITNNKIESSTTDDFRSNSQGANENLTYTSTYTISGNSSSVSFNYSVGASHVASLITSLINTLSGVQETPSTVEIVPNGDFENGNDGNWVIQSGSAIQGTETYNGSSYAVSITPNGYYRKTWQDIPVIAGEVLSASGYMKIVGFDGVKNAHYQLRFYDTDSAGSHSGSESTPYQISVVNIAVETATENNDWEFFLLDDITVPADADFVRPWLGANPSTTGTVYFDNISVMASTGLPGTELLLDGGFEDENSSNQWDNIHSTSSFESTGGVDGSVGLYQPATSGWTNSWQYVDVTGITSLNASAAIWATNLAAGYRAFYQIRFYDSSSNSLGNAMVGEVYEGNSGYEQFVADEIEVPTNAVTAQAFLAVTGGGQGNARFDNIQLRAAP